jgi:hypothetical protein
MIDKTYTCSLLGTDAIIWSFNLPALAGSLVEVEVDLASGFPGFAK